MLARIRPFDARRGRVVRRYLVAGRRYEERRGWYEVTEEQASRLRELTILPPGSVDPVRVFDVCTPDEAQALDIQEGPKGGTGTAEAPNRIEGGSPDLTLKDVRPDLQLAREREDLEEERQMLADDRAALAQEREELAAELRQLREGRAALEQARRVQAPQADPEDQGDHEEPEHQPNEHDDGQAGEPEAPAEEANKTTKKAGRKRAGK